MMKNLVTICKTKVRQQIAIIRFAKLLAVFGTAVSIVACVAIPEQKFVSEQALESEALQKVNAIAVLDIPNPPHYHLGEGIGPATFFFGALGAAAELSAVGRDTKAYGDFNFGAAMQQRIVERLSANGYRVESKQVNRQNQYRLIDDYRSLNITGTDVFLDIAPVEVGFKRNPLAGPFSREIGPHISLVIRLISTDTKNILYAESVQYGYAKNPFARGIRIDSPDEHTFPNVDALKANRDRAIKQLIIGIDKISLAIAERLAK